MVAMIILLFIALLVTQILPYFYKKKEAIVDKYVNRIVKTGKGRFQVQELYGYGWRKNLNSRTSPSENDNYKDGGWETFEQAKEALDSYLKWSNEIDERNNRQNNFEVIEKYK